MIEYKLYVIAIDHSFHEICGTAGYCAARLADFGKTRYWQLWNAYGTHFIAAKR